MITQSKEGFKSIFLLGAGASIPAGISSIDKMTKEFLADPIPKGIKLTTMNTEMFEVTSLDGKNSGEELRVHNSKQLSKKFSILSETAQAHYGRSDLEALMSILTDLEDGKLRELFENKYPSLKELEDGNTIRIPLYTRLGYKELFEKYIRMKCENITNTEYLWALSGLARNGNLEIFTLNYDAVLEIFCEKNNIPFTDGFNPYWSPSNFKENVVNIYKLHGSLYWLKTQIGKVIKVPLKGLSIPDVRYLTDESLSEMMIYPTIKKNKESEIYSWLSQHFRDKLREADFCIVIGYSFRDEEIKNSLMESLYGNSNLWLLLVNPDADKLKNKFFNDKEMGRRVVVMNIGIEEAIGNRELHEYVTTLNDARRREELAWNLQSMNQGRLDTEWTSIINFYYTVNHHDRIKWIVEEIYKKRFTSVNCIFPNSIEGKIGPFSLRYAMDYKNNNKEKFNLWKEIFLNSCLVAEYCAFTIENPLWAKFNPIKQTELPWWHWSNSARGSVAFYLEEFKKKLSDLKEPSLKNAIDKMIKTIDILTGKGETDNQNAEVLSRCYIEEDLGLKKWSKNIINLLE